MMQAGIYIIEGIDGSGKSTQHMLLEQWLGVQNIKHHSFKYPAYDTLSGRLVSDYLNNLFGNADSIHPRLASLLYSFNRFETKGILADWLKSGDVVLLDRYATANMGHQLSKCQTDDERLEFLAWLEKVEYEIFAIPRPTKVFWLDMPVAKAMDLLAHREEKEYIQNTKLDGHENSAHLKKARNAYAFVADRQPEWIKIECVDKKGDLLSPEEIHQSIIEKFF